MIIGEGKHSYQTEQIAGRSSGVASSSLRLGLWVIIAGGAVEVAIVKFRRNVMFLTVWILKNWETAKCLRS